MFIARFKMNSGMVSLPIDRKTLLEGFKMHGFKGKKAIQATNDLSRGIPIILGRCTIKQSRPKATRRQLL